MSVDEHIQSDMAAALTADLAVITGMSGAGKSLALKSLEDLGYEAVDNLPLSLLERMVRGGNHEHPLAVGIDIRTREFDPVAVHDVMESLRTDSMRKVQLIFIDSDDETLRRRFTETRRRHPLALDRPLTDGISHERTLISPLRQIADWIVDTSHLTPTELKDRLRCQFGRQDSRGLVAFISSFAYRQGLPREADLVFDVRFLNNPHYVPDLKPKTGRDADVAAYIAADPAFPAFFDNLVQLLEPLLPRYQAEGKSYLTIAVGCTGGRHRSVFVAERLAQWLNDHGGRVELKHRDLDGRISR